jgi:membrane protease YdiL (CAAX protease family)
MLNKLRNQLLTIIVFILSSSGITLSIYLGIPFFMKYYNLRFGEAYLFCFYSPFFLLFISNFIIYKIEGHSFSLKSYTSRLRLNKLDKHTIKWLALFFVIIFIGFAITSKLGQLISDNISFFSIPDFLPGGLNHNKKLLPGYFFDIPLSNNWLFAIFYFIGWFFNIFGEELMFRGILLPRNEKTFNKYAWLFQGVLWGIWHVYWFWQFIPLTFFVALPLLYVVQKTKNTWVGIIIHGTLNLIPLIYIIIQIVRS